MTSVIRIYSGKSKPANKKPGWQKAEQEYKDWQAKVNSMTLFNPSAKPKMQISKSRIDPIVKESYIDPSRLQKVKSVISSVDTCTKVVYRPEVTYRDNPEMLERELIARSKKFNTAPAYNKGGDMLCTDEMMKDVMSGANRRRN